jgi:F-type H+-transporting ATPase subunit b
MIEYFWLLISLIILVLVLWKPVKEQLIGALDRRADQIRRELDEAQRLREEAQALLARHQRQLHDGEGLAASILQHGAEENVRVEKQLRADLAASIERRTRAAEERIAQEEASAVAEIRGKAADLAIRTTRRLLAEQLDPAKEQDLISSAIKDVRQKLA